MQSVEKLLPMARMRNERGGVAGVSPDVVSLAEVPADVSGDSVSDSSVSDADVSDADVSGAGVSPDGTVVVPTVAEVPGVVVSESSPPPVPHEASIPVNRSIARVNETQRFFIFSADVPSPSASFLS